MIYLNDLEIKPTIFPDKTSQVWKLPRAWRKNHVFIRWDFESEAEVMHLAQLQDLLGCHGINATLELSYLPYGRQDKEILADKGDLMSVETFALRTFATILNNMNFFKIKCMDPHSDVAQKLIKNLHVVSPEPFIAIAKKQTDSTFFCYPDKGAVAKYKKMFPVHPYAFGEKTRNQQTGEIVSYDLVTLYSPKDSTVLIVDDICDGGMTFIKLAEMLKKAGAREINLFITHGIFSKGTEPLFAAGIKRIFTQKGEAVRTLTEETFTGSKSYGYIYKPY